MRAHVGLAANKVGHLPSSSFTGSRALQGNLALA